MCTRSRAAAPHSACRGGLFNKRNVAHRRQSYMLMLAKVHASHICIIHTCTPNILSYFMLDGMVATQVSPLVWVGGRVRRLGV